MKPCDISGLLTCLLIRVMWKSIFSKGFEQTVTYFHFKKLTFETLKPKKSSLWMCYHLFLETTKTNMAVFKICLNCDLLTVKMHIADYHIWIGYGYTVLADIDR